MRDCNITDLRSLARFLTNIAFGETIIDEDITPAEASSRDINAAYQRGVQDGFTLLARHILTEGFEPWRGNYD